MTEIMKSINYVIHQSEVALDSIYINHQCGSIDKAIIISHTFYNSEREEEFDNYIYIDGSSLNSLIECLQSIKREIDI